MWSVVRVNVFVPVVARWVRKLNICYSKYTQCVVLISFLISWLLFSSHTVNTGVVIWGSSLEKTQTSVWCLDLVLWHWHWTWWTHCQGDFGPQKKAITKLDYSPFLPIVAPFDLWLLTELKTALTRLEIFWYFWHSGTYDDHPEGYSRRAIFWTVKKLTH